MNAKGRVNCSSSCKESVSWANGSWSYSIPVKRKGAVLENASVQLHSVSQLFDRRAGGPDQGRAVMYTPPSIAEGCESPQAGTKSWVSIASVYVYFILCRTRD